MIDYELIEIEEGPRVAFAAPQENSRLLSYRPILGIPGRFGETELVRKLPLWWSIPEAWRNITKETP